MNRESLDRILRWGLVGILAAMLLYALLATGAYRREDFLVVQALGILGGLLWCARLWINPEPRVLITGVGWCILAFCAYAGIWFFFADLKYVARWELTRIVLYALMFFLAVNHFHRQKFANWVLFPVMACATLVAGYAFYQYITHSDQVWHFIRPQAYTGRGSGTFICPNHLAGFLEVLLPLALGYIFWSKQKALSKVLLTYAALWFFAGIIVAQSRLGWIVTGVGLVVFTLSLMWEYRFRLYAGVVLLLLLAGGVVIELKTGTFLKRFKRDNPAELSLDIDLRQGIWKSATGVWLENPWFGAGPGHFNYRFRPHRPPQVQGQPERAHNDYLNVLADYGVVGALPLGAAVFLVFGAVWRHWSKRFLRAEEGAEASTRSAPIVGGGIGVLIILLHSIGEFHLYITANALLVAAVVGAIIANRTGKQTAARASLTLAGRCGATIVVLAATAFLAWQAQAGWAEARWLGRARAERQNVNAQLAAYERAFALEPGNFDTAYAIGELCRTMSWEGTEDYEDWANRAITWYQRAAAINPRNSYYFARQGMCLDRLSRNEEALPYYEKALKLDPNNADIVAFMGWHFAQRKEFVAAREWLIKAMTKRPNHPFATQYYHLVTAHMPPQ